MKNFYPSFVPLKKQHVKRLAMLLCLFTLVLAQALFPVAHLLPKAEQAGVFARLLSQSTPFYSDPGCNILKFYLPKTYYVKVLEIGEDATRILYMDGVGALPSREGYIKTCDLFLCEQEPSAPYPEVYLSVKADEILFADTKKAYPKAVLSPGESAVYYGDMTIDGESFFYVYASGYIGYVRKSAFLNPVIPLHPTPVISEEPSAQPESSSPITQPEISDGEPQAGISLDTTMKTVVIIAVALVTMCVIYLLFRPRQTTLKTASTRTDDDEF